MAMQNESGELGLIRPPVNGLDARSERDSGLSLPKMMVLVSEREAIQAY